MILSNAKLWWYDMDGIWTEINDLISCDIWYSNSQSRPTWNRTGFYSNETIDSIEINFKRGSNAFLDGLSRDDKISLKYLTGSQAYSTTFTIGSKYNTKVGSETQTFMRLTPVLNVEVKIEGNATGRITDVKQNGTSVVDPKGVANIETSQYAEKTSVVKYTDILDSVTSTSTTNVPAMKTVKDLSDRIDNLSSAGRYLSGWNCTTGMPDTQPSDLPYTYKTGDYYIISAVGETNYKPDGTQYTGTASTTPETGSPGVNDYYRFDGTIWRLYKGTLPNVEFSKITGNCLDNASLASQFNTKMDKVNGTGTGTTTLENLVVSSTTNVPAPTTDSSAVTKLYSDNKIIRQDGAPTEATVGILGQIYEDSATGKVYKCEGINPYVWKELGEGKVIDVLVDGSSVVTNKIANVNLTGKQNKVYYGANAPTNPIDNDVWVQDSVGLSETQKQSDWEQGDNTQVDYIKNKPHIYRHNISIEGPSTESLELYHLTLITTSASQLTNYNTLKNLLVAMGRVSATGIYVEGTNYWNVIALYAVGSNLNADIVKINDPEVHMRTIPSDSAIFDRVTRIF